MILLSFAHRGEAQTFIKKIQGLKSINAICPLYQSNESKVMIAITGEGIFNAISNVSYILGKYSNIDQVIKETTIGNKMISKINEFADLKIKNLNY